MKLSQLALRATLSALVAEAAPPRLFSSAFGYPGQNATFDYVVIGGGTAGLTIAARLAANHSVAVVEAGSFYEITNGNNSVVPLLDLTGTAFIDTSETFTPQPLMDWGLVSEPITGAAGQSVHYAQGKTLGGSSAINTMSYVRGSKGAYAKWAEVVGDESYTFENMLPFFQKSVHLTPPDEGRRNNTNVTVVYDPAGFSDEGGPLQVSWNNYVDPTITWLAKAIEEGAGLPISEVGFQTGELVGHGAWVPGTIEPEKATRSSSETSFLHEAIETTEIKVYVLTQATKILFDESTTPKATGVAVNSLGVEYTLSANKEVIVSAGTFHSPQLLMVSGIGPASTLSALDIPVISDLAGVGKNLHDPIQIFAAYPVKTPSAQTLVANPALQPTFLEQYLEDGSGPYSSAAGYLAFERIPSAYRDQLSNDTQAKLAAYPSDWPEFSYIGGSFVGENLTATGTLSAWLPLVFSRGNITIGSASITDQPVISLNWFEDPADMELAVTALKRLRFDIWDSSAANEVKAGPELLPGGSVLSDEDVEAYIRQQALPIWHACGTCAMGKEGDETAVVDSQGKVFGVEGLRVCDASVYPFSLPAHPQAGVYALAEKIAADILGGS